MPTATAAWRRERWTAPQYFSTVVHTYGDRKNKDYGSVVANSLINLGYVYTYHYVEYARTYSCLTEAISIGGKTPGNRNLCTAYLNIANIYLITGIGRAASLFFSRRYLKLEFQ